MWYRILNRVTLSCSTIFIFTGALVEWLDFWITLRFNVDVQSTFTPQCIFKKSVNFFGTIYFFCVEDHHSPLESDLTRSYMYSRSSFTFRKRYGSVRTVLFVWSLKSTSILIWTKMKEVFLVTDSKLSFFLSKERIKFPYKNSYYLIFYNFIFDVDQTRTYLTYVRYFIFTYYIHY